MCPPPNVLLLNILLFGKLSILCEMYWKDLIFFGQSVPRGNAGEQQRKEMSTQSINPAYYVWSIKEAMAITATISLLLLKISIITPRVKFVYFISP